MVVSGAMTAQLSMKLKRPTRGSTTECGFLDCVWTLRGFIQGSTIDGDNRRAARYTESTNKVVATSTVTAGLLIFR